MATTKKAAAKPQAATKKVQVEVTNIDDAEPSFIDGADVDEPAKDELPVSTDGYVWVSRKLPVQIGMVNPVFSEPALIDAKSFPELELQGYRVVDAPEAD